MVTGKVTDKATGAPIHGVKIYLTDINGATLVNDDGPIYFETDKQGNFNVDIMPNQMVFFDMPGYILVDKTYEQLVRNGNIILDDGAGTALTLKEVEAFMADTAKNVNAKWLITTGMLMLLAVFIIIILKKWI